MADDTSRNRRGHRHGHDRPRVGRHPRTEHAAAALVAVAVLRHASSGRSATGSSIRPGRWSPATRKGVLGWHSRTAIVDDLAALKAQRGADDGQACRRLVAADRSRSAAAPTLPARSGQVGVRATIARPATARAAAARKGYPNLNDDDWLWGGKLARHQQTIRMAFARPTTRPGRATCRRSAATACSKPARDLERRRLCALAVGPAGREGADLAAGKKVFADNCAACHGDEGKGNQRARRAQSDRRDLALRLRQADDRRGHHNGRGGVMPAWGGRLDPTDDQGARRLRPLAGGGE